MCISRICVVLLKLSILFNMETGQGPTSVLIWPHLPLNILFSEIHLRTEMNLISQHAHINNPSDGQFHASFNLTGLSIISSVGESIMGSTSVVMSWYTLSDWALGSLAWCWPIIYYSFSFFFREREREHAGIYNQTLTSVMGPPRHLSVMIISHILIICMMSFVLTMCQTVCV